MEEFVALDFETANQYRESACSVGLVKFNEHADIIDTWYSLIKPPSQCNEFMPRNVMIHGIHSRDVINAPTWADIYEDISEFILDRPLVAHNMPFDGSVINKLAQFYHLPAWLNVRHCTLKLSRNLLKNRLDSFGLESVYDFYFPDQEFDHHNAYADAVACGKIFAQLNHEFGQDVISDVTKNGAKSHYLRQLRRDIQSRDIRISRGKHYKMPYIPRKVAFLTGAKVCISGTLSYGSRTQVESLITSLGGTVTRAVNSQTTLLLVCATPDERTYAKIASALQLQKDGAVISIMNEDEFFRGLREVAGEFS
ncbi:DNA polymerase III subunit epsilon [Alloscardovia theropitheci]|uniref:DNA polymerase III subunit epsilon n=1 Tax=Alloscardovia theropitheci TaxID=2496842 RepID=A0A4R0QUA5_9BIFI|nr:exonuclease domain-containing protein [Alloscardovia theropitheci]TCD53537.1 DNA polymerase III subunit epsilon [Alloscardovia theropitheci]